MKKNASEEMFYGHQLLTTPVFLKILVSTSPTLMNISDSLLSAQRMVKGELCGLFKMFHGYKYSAQENKV